MLCNISDVNDDILNKWCLHIIKMTLKLRLTDIIDCYNDDMIDKYVQIINLTVKECRDLLLLMHHKMKRNFLLNWVVQLLKCLAIVAILIFNNVAAADVVIDMFWTAKTTERIQFVVDVIIMTWHWGDVSMSEQESKEIAENIMLWSDDISENWDKNEIEMQCMWWHYCERRM